MNGRKILWGVPVAIWLTFTFWYTDLGGSLTSDEISRGLQDLKDRGYSSDAMARVEAFLQNDTGRQFLMVNNIQMNDNPPQMAGFGADATAADYRDHYMEHMYSQLLSRACHPIFYAAGQNFVADITGVDRATASGWDTAALFRYRSRRSFLEIITHPAMRGRHDYKIAAMTKTIAYPVEPSLYVSDLRFILFLVLGLITALVDILLFQRREVTKNND